MKPSQAQALGSTLSNLLSQKPKDARYTRLRADEAPMDEAAVHISKKRGPSCCKRCAVFFVACLLLSALTGSLLYVIGSNTYTVQVQIAAGNSMNYEFDHQVTINASRVTARHMSGQVTFWAVNKSGAESWLHMAFTPRPTENVRPLYLFALKVKLKDKYGDGSTDQNYELFGDGRVDRELAHHVHCLLRQILPVVKMKLYKVFLSRLRNSYKQVVEVDSPFLPGPTKLHQTVASTDRLVTISNRAGSRDFLSFRDREYLESRAQVAWDFQLNERTVLSKETGMAVDSHLSLTARVPLGEGVGHMSASDVTHLGVSFDSVVKLKQDEGQKQDTGFARAHWVSVPFPMSFGPPQISFFRPQKKQSLALQELLDNSARLVSNGPRSQFGKLPAIVTLRHSDSDDDDDADSYDGDRDDEREDDWQTIRPPPPPLPDFAPFGFEDRRKRSLRMHGRRKTRPAAVPTRKSGRWKTKLSKADLSAVWDELSTSTLSSYPKRSMRIVHTSLFGLPVVGEVEYQVKGADDDDDDDYADDDYEDNDEREDSTWSVLVSFYLHLGPYRFSVFERAHKLKNITTEVLRASERLKAQHWNETAGDLVVCAPFFFMQTVCVELRLVFTLTASYSSPKFSMAYPVELNVRVEHTALVNSAVSAHVSTWFHKGGLYSVGGLLRAKLPLLLSFREDARPEWCAKSNIETRLIRLSDVPFAEWNCSLSCRGKFPMAEHSFAELSARSPFWQNWHFLDSCEDDV